jgi:hypothetical protein
MVHRRPQAVLHCTVPLRAFTGEIDGWRWSRQAAPVEIARLHRQLGATMIYVTHDQIEAMTLASASWCSTAA